MCLAQKHTCVQSQVTNQMWYNMLSMKSQFYRLEKLKIVNYKGIDDLVVVFPDGLVVNDPDVNILGSKNGVGKTSVLECCAWVLLAMTIRADVISDMGCDFSELVKSGAKEATISGYFSGGARKKLHRVTIRFRSKGDVRTSGTKGTLSRLVSEEMDTLADRIQGKVSEPAQGENFFFLHSYRKVREGRPELGALLDEDVNLWRPRRRISMRSSSDGASFSMFKRLIVKHLMQKADLFESSAPRHQEQENASINVLNGLLSQYAEVRVGKLKPYANNTIDVMVEKLSHPGKRFSIDGLSSGQKEIISTLFLIWNATYGKPSTVLIDEPELHLNEQWHAGFVRKLVELAPANQYILATHAKAIMESVRGRNRHLLVGDIEEGARPQ